MGNFVLIDLLIICLIKFIFFLFVYFSEETFNKWIPSLTKMLSESQSVSVIVLRTFSMLAKQKNPNFLKQLNQNAMLILANLAQIKIQGINNQFEGRKLLINLFFWMEVITVKGILSEIDDVELEDDVKLYLRDILTLKIESIKNN